MLSWAALQCSRSSSRLCSVTHTPLLIAVLQPDSLLATGAKQLNMGKRGDGLFEKSRKMEGGVCACGSMGGRAGAANRVGAGQLGLGAPVSSRLKEGEWFNRRQADSIVGWLPARRKTQAMRVKRWCMSQHGRAARKEGEGGRWGSMAGDGLVHSGWKEDGGRQLGQLGQDGRGSWGGGGSNQAVVAMGAGGQLPTCN